MTRCAYRVETTRFPHTPFALLKGYFWCVWKLCENHTLGTQHSANPQADTQLPIDAAIPLHRRGADLIGCLLTDGDRSRS